MRKSVGLRTAFLIACLGYAHQEKPVPFNAQAALGYIKDLASDSMLGRKSGQPGGVLAEDYVATRLKEWGVEPGGVGGTFFQPFTFPHSNVNPGARLEILCGGKKREFYYGDGWRVWSYSGSGRFLAEIVFVGYGIHAPENGYDDFAGVDIKGKMALLILETPQNLNQTLGDELDLQKRIQTIQQQGARGVLICPSPIRENRTIRGFPGGEVYKPDFVILRIEPDVVEYVFKDLPTELSVLIQELDSAPQPRAYSTGVMASVEVDAVFDENRLARNVLGRISGTDEKLRGEYIIVAAHLDHMGIDPWGEVLNGANDNASGTAVALEVARVLNQSRSKLKRSVVFFLWAAEEQGFQGLNYYCRQPVYPLNNTVAYITMDMVGHGSGMVSASGKDYRPDLWGLLIRSIPEIIMRYIEPGKRFSARLPDWEPLLPTGIARIGIQTSGSHMKFHTSRDDVDLIKPELLERTGNFVRAAVEVLAGEPGNLIPEFRREDYYLKVARLIDCQPLSLGQIAAHPEEAGASWANIRLAIAEEVAALDGDALRVDVTKGVLSSLGAIKKRSGFSVYSSLARLQEDIAQRRTAVIPGLGSIRTLDNDPLWAKALAAAGIRFVRLADPSPFFSGDNFTQEGRETWNALEANGIVMMVSGLTPARRRILLENAGRPFILIEKGVPSAEVLELMKKKRAVLALVLDSSGAAGYFQKLDRAKRVLESGRLMIWNGHPVKENGSIELFRRLTHEILEAGYEWKDILNLFSGTFLSLFE
jgi:hypothetical protein